MLKSSAKVFLSWGSFFSLQTALLIPVKYRTSKVFAISPWWNHEQHINSEEWPEISFKRAKSDIRDLQGATVATLKRIRCWKRSKSISQCNNLSNEATNGCHWRCSRTAASLHHLFFISTCPHSFFKLRTYSSLLWIWRVQGQSVCELYTLFAFCRDQCTHHPSCHFWVELHKGFAITYTTITVLHNKNECPATQGWQSVLWVWYSRDWIPLAAWSIRLRNHYA